MAKAPILQALKHPLLDPHLLIMAAAHQELSTTTPHHICTPHPDSFLQVKARSDRRYVSKTAFPTEIVDNVVSYLIGDDQSFRTIANFSLACFTFRQIAFRRHFRTLRARQKDQWFRRVTIPGVFLWVRHLQCNSNALYVRSDMLGELVNLESATISFHEQGRHTQHTSTRLVLRHMPTTLTHLTLDYLPLINPALIQLVTDAFPKLRSLRLSCCERLLADLDCCWDCYAEGGSCTVHSPIPDYYFDVYELTESFGQALAPLTDLEDLLLGIYLSPEDIFYEHIEHSEDPVAAPTPYGPNTCDFCEKLHAEETRQIELAASADIAQYLPMLKTISWKTFFAKKRTQAVADEQITTMTIERGNAQLTVKRCKL